MSRPVHPLNVKGSIDVIDSDNFTEVNPVHPLKAFEPTLTMEFGKDTDVNNTHHTAH